MDEWARAIELWIFALRAAARPDTTIYLRQYQITRLAVALAPIGPWQVTGQQLVAWAASQSWARETRRSWRSAMRGFYGWALAEGWIDVDPARSLLPIKPEDPDPHPAPEDAYRLARAQADDRVGLMLRLAAELGMRRGEVAKTHSDDLERDLYGWSLRVRGKGDRVRRIPLEDSLAAAIRRHVDGRGYLFPGAIDGHLSAAWVGKLVSRALPEAWAMHSLRHRFATVAYAHDRDTFTVQTLLGHASPETTRRYVLIPDDALRRTVAAVAAAS